jgi:dihydroorotase (multifunctional complex type)
MEFELGVEGGTVVTSTGRWRANVYVSGGRIAEVTEQGRPARENVDAEGMLVMPGMVDAHVHFMDPSATDREDFITGTSAAARAGVTTVIEHTHSSPVRTPTDLHAKAEHLAGRSFVDFALGAHAWIGMAEEVAPLWRAGAAFVKAFTCTTHGVPGHSPAELLTLFRAVAAIGGTCLVHCEEESLTAAAERELRQAGRSDGGVIPAWRNREAELVAVATTAQLAGRTGARVVVAHASNPEVLDLARPVCLVESCPQYLTLLEAEVLEQGSLRKFTPPARAESARDLEEMWVALAAGSIDYVASDHAPSTLAQKREGSIWDVHFGLPGIDTTLAVLLDGAHAGRLTYERVVEVYSEAPARIYGLHPRKGSLDAGADADLVLVDPERRWTVRDEDVVSKAGWSPYAGRTFIGGAVRTFLRGRAPKAGAGRFLPGPGAR